jgi:hypothetical protein
MRISSMYGMGEFLDKVLTASDDALDALALGVGIKRIVVEVPIKFDGETLS